MIAYVNALCNKSFILDTFIIVILIQPCNIFYMTWMAAELLMASANDGQELS